MNYPEIKADLALCYRQLFELCKGERKEALMRIPRTEKDFDIQFSAAFDELIAYRKLDTADGLKALKQAEQERQEKRQKYERIRNEIMNKEFVPDDDPPDCEQYCGDCPHRICGKKQSGDILNGANYTKIIVRNEATGEDIAVITNDEVTTADSDIVVALTPKCD